MLHPYQQKALDAWDEGRDMLILLPTGRGKSLCYQLPSVGQTGLTLVISPLIALMQDQVSQLQNAGVSAEYLSALRSPEETRLIFDRIESLSLLYVTPERLHNKRFLDAIGKIHLRAVVVDEAHCVSLWGKTFRPSYRRIQPFLRMYPKALRVALSATVTPRVKKDIQHQLCLRSPVCITESPMRKDISLHIHFREDGFRLLRLLLSKKSPGIIYTQSRYECERLCFLLRDTLPEISLYHAGLSKEQREHTLRDFSSGKTPWIVATSAFGMGIDKSDIRTIIHFQPPPSLEDYLQQTGRASRDGRGGEAHLLIEPKLLLKYGKQRRLSLAKFLTALLRGKCRVALRMAHEDRLWRSMEAWIGQGLSLRYLTSYFSGKTPPRLYSMPFNLWQSLLQGTNDSLLLLPQYAQKRGIPSRVFWRWLWHKVGSHKTQFSVKDGKFWIMRGETS